MTAPTPPQDDSAAPTRDRIKQIAGDFYVLRGYDGFSFGDIAQVIGTTRANIHHHFGSKRKLMAELIENFVQDAEARIMRHWSKPETPFFMRIDSQVADLRQFHGRFNANPGDRNVWSPLARLRLDLPVLGNQAAAALEQVNARYEVTIRQAAHQAIAAGELRANAPVDDIVRILRMTILSCGPMTQDTGSFDEVQSLFDAIGRTIVQAWSTQS